MTAAQLRLLAILAFELVTDAIQQLHVALVWVLFECRDEGPGHSPGSFTANRSVGPVDGLVFFKCFRRHEEEIDLRGLCILGSTPHDYIGWAGLGSQILFVYLVTLRNLLK